MLETYERIVTEMCKENVVLLKAGKTDELYTTGSFDSVKSHVMDLSKISDPKIDRFWSRSTNILSVLFLLTSLAGWMAVVFKFVLQINF